MIYILLLTLYKKTKIETYFGYATDDKMIYTQTLKYYKAE
jgi:hypothetical protein